MKRPKQDAFVISLQFLKKDPRLGPFITAHGPVRHRREHSSDPFQALAEAIIYQQLSGKAAATILQRFVAIFPHKKFPSPEKVVRISPEQLRAVGLSTQKAAYLKDLAAKFLDGTIDPKNFHHLSDQEIIEHVTAVKGVGEWTAQMFLMFTLGRPDVLPTGDLGIQKAFRKMFKLKRLPTPAQMERLARPWLGHRTLACFYLWRYVDSGGVE